MRQVVVLTGRLLLAHWPALVAWFLAGTLGRYIGLEVAGFVGGYSALGGLLLLPVAILAKLVSVVAMFLVLRDGLPRLGAIAPAPVERAARLRSFRDALLASILPFFAVALVLAFAVAGPLDAMALGDDLAVAQGVRLARIRVLTDRKSVV